MYNIAHKGVPSSCAVLTDSIMSDSATPWTEPTRLPCPWEFSRQGHWSDLQCPTPGDLPNPGIEPRSPALQADSLPTELSGKPQREEVKKLKYEQNSRKVRGSRVNLCD